MKKLTVGYGIFLVGLGIGGYLLTGKQSKTALIPAGFGAAALGLGLVMRRRNWKRKATWAGAIVSLAGFAGTRKSLKKARAMFRGEETERPAAVVSQSLMAVASVVHFVSSARSLWKGCC